MTGFCRVVLHGKPSTVLFLGVLVTGAALADDQAPVLTGPYFGQQPPGFVAAPFAPDLISIPGRYEFAISFAPGGERLVFTVQTEGGTVQVMHSRVTDGIWTRPEPINLAAGARRDEMEAFFSHDGKHLYFAPYDEGLDVRIWQVEIAGNEWINPAPLTGPIAAAPAFFPTSAASGAIYYTNIAERRPYRAGAMPTARGRSSPSISSSAAIPSSLPTSHSFSSTPGPKTVAARATSTSPSRPPKAAGPNRSTSATASTPSIPSPVRACRMTASTYSSAATTSRTRWRRSTGLTAV